MEEEHNNQKITHQLRSKITMEIVFGQMKHNYSEQYENVTRILLVVVFNVGSDNCLIPILSFFFQFI